MDEQHIKELISEMLNDRLAAQAEAHLSANVELTLSPTSAPDGGDFMRELMKRSLRKNDMFALFGENRAIVVFANVKDDAREMLQKRMERLARDLSIESAKPGYSVKITTEVMTIIK